MSDLVTVACKLPSGLIIGGVKVLGTTVDRGSGSTLPPPVLYGGYAITDNFPADTWREWHTANATSAVVVNRIVMADADRATLIAMARSNSRTRSGFEAIGGGQQRSR